MDIITLDFETYFDNEYTLSRGKNQKTTEEYIRDPRFEVHGCGIRWPNGSKRWFNKTDFANMLGRDYFARSACLAHHAHFEGLILSHHFGMAPGLWLDTLPMARALLGNHVRVGLESLAAHFGLQPKSVPYEKFRGRHWDELDNYTQREIADGCLHDCDLTWDMFQRLAVEFPAEEYGVIDATICMFSEPTIIGDTALLAEVWTDERDEREALLAQLGVTAEQLRSNDSFAWMLNQVGVEIEWKAGKNGPIPAFAKSDDFMRDLLEDADDNIRLLAEARLDAQSTFAQTRAERLGWMSRRGAMCVYINAYGAHTTRDSGGDKVNFQNFQRGSKEFPKRGRIRRSMVAPVGYKVGVIDASQIECRMLNEFAGQHDIVQKFREKRDLYSEIASQFYNRPVSKDTPAERGTGKQLELSCGYGAGAHTIVVTAKKGVYGPPVFLTEAEGEDAKNLYRSTHQAVQQLWWQAGDILKLMAGSDCDFTWNCVRVLCDTQTGRKRIILPNGLPLIYDTLEWYVPDEVDPEQLANQWDAGGYWRIKTRKGYVKMYGAKLVENVIQAIARVHLTQVMLRIRAAAIRIWSRCHDELALLIRDDENAQATLEWCIAQMRVPPAWMPNVPLDAEGLLGERYEK